jgi:hypothetical protein
MRTIVLVLSLIALAAPSHAAQKTKAKTQDAASMAKKCRQMVGKEEPEATDGRSHVGPAQCATLQRLHDGRATFLISKQLPIAFCPNGGRTERKFPIPNSSYGIVTLTE